MSIRVFCSYSHRDEALRGQLEAHLSQLVRNGEITAWHDRQISVGTDWKSQIDTQIELAQIVLLLVSADFLNSQYCYGIEMARAIERHAKAEARIIPIIVRPCDWAESPLRSLQVLPTDGKPVTSWLNHDEAWLDVVRGIRKACGEINRIQEPGVLVYAEHPESGRLAWPKCSVRLADAADSSLDLQYGAIKIVALEWGKSVKTPLKPETDYVLIAYTGIPMSVTVAVARTNVKVRNNEVLHYVYRVVVGAGKDFSESYREARLLQVVDL